MSGDTPDGSPDGVLPVTSRKFPMLIAARSTPVGASSAMTCDEGVAGMTAGSVGGERVAPNLEHRTARGTLNRPAPNGHSAKAQRRISTAPPLPVPRRYARLRPLKGRRGAVPEERRA